MKLSPDLLAACYDFMAETQPFVRWNLPASDDVVFVVSRSPSEFGRYWWKGGHHIAISERCVGHTSTLVEKVAHEMIHLHLEATGMESATGDNYTHNAAFRKYAADVCRHHGFDPKSFY